MLRGFGAHTGCKTVNQSNATHFRLVLPSTTIFDDEASPRVHLHSSFLPSSHL